MNVSQADVKCERRSCFGNRCGLCVVLAESIIDKPCPFFKTKARHENELKALEANNMSLYKAAEVYDRVIE